MDDEKPPARPCALLALLVLTVWFGPLTVDEPQRSYWFQFCVVEPERPVVGLLKLAWPVPPSGPHDALPCAYVPVFAL